MLQEIKWQLDKQGSEEAETRGLKYGRGKGKKTAIGEGIQGERAKILCYLRGCMVSFPLEASLNIFNYE